MEPDETAVNGRARWVLATAVPVLVTILLAMSGWSIRQHEILNTMMEQRRAEQVQQHEQLHALEIRQEDVLRRLTTLEERARVMELWQAGHR